MDRDLKQYDGAALLSMMIYGEARNQPVEGQIAVACVARNRVLTPCWWGKTWKTVLLKPWQFSCFNKNDPNLPKVVAAWENRNTVENKYFEQARYIACGVLNGEFLDNTQGATHYHHRGIRLPDWAVGQIALAFIGDHIFYRIR